MRVDSVLPRPGFEVCPLTWPGMGGRRDCTADRIAGLWGGWRGGRRQDSSVSASWRWREVRTEYRVSDLAAHG